MKILIVIPYFTSVYGGPAKVMRELSQSLAKLGTAVDIVTTNANGPEKLDVPLNQWIEEGGYRVQYFECWHRNDLIISSALSQWLLRNVQSYNVVHTNNIFAPLTLVTEWICQFHHVPYVITPHGMLEPWAFSYKAGKKRFYYRLLENPALRKASAIHVLTPLEAQNLQTLGLGQTAVVPNGIHHQEFDSQCEAEPFYQQFPETKDKSLILFLGRIDPKKGLDLLAPAFGKIHRQFQQAHLIVAGPDSIGFLPTVKRYFLEAGCLEAVTFTGMLTGEVKQAALAAAQIYVAPSYSEGFSMSVLEGMAAGLPCVITTECNFPEAAAAGVAHVVDLNSDAIADAILQCLSNPGLAKDMGQRARNFILQNYTWDQAAQRLIQVYEAVIEQKSLPAWTSAIQPVT